MAVTVKVDLIDKDIDLIFEQDLSGEARSAALANYSREVLGDAEETNLSALGHVPLHETFVDGRSGASEDSVRPDGEISYAFNILEDLFAWIAEQLVIYSPVLTGRFAASFKFFADGVEIDPAMPAPQAQSYVFLNIQPYARKIERGESPQAPDGVFQSLAALAQRRFGNVARVRFGWQSPILAYGGAPSRRGGLERETRTPAIIITLRS
jgi:hypothetical protein